jgi:hypothetical protein
MKFKLIALLVFIGCAGLAAGQTITDPAHIEVYITPYYNSKGPAIEVGPFSSGLAAKSESEFVATIAKMKRSWETLNFAETYVAAIRLYNLRFRKESIYWFYSANQNGIEPGGLAASEWLHRNFAQVATARSWFQR